MNTKTNLILDLTIFAAFLAVYNTNLTGISLHEWLALALAAAVLLHLLLHWNWMIGVFKRFFKKLFHQSRLNMAVDVLFFLALTVSMTSGLMISRTILPTLGIRMNGMNNWKTLHVLSSDLSFLLLGLHFALHFKWLLFNLKQRVVKPLADRLHLAGKQLNGKPYNGKILAAQTVEADPNRE